MLVSFWLGKRKSRPDVSRKVCSFHMASYYRDDIHGRKFVKHGRLYASVGVISARMRARMWIFFFIVVLVLL